jgi:hypothetical protein
MSGLAPGTARFIGALVAARRRAWGAFYQQRHWWRRRQRLERRARRRAQRRSRQCSLWAWQERLCAPLAWHARDRLLTAQRPAGAPLREALTTPDFSAQVVADLAAIELELELNGLPPLTLQDESLAWQLELDDYDGSGYDLGRFSVELRFDGAVSVTGGDCNYQGHVHPHVASNGQLCVGRFDNLPALLWRDGALELVWSTINQILRTYNPQSPYCHLNELVQGSVREECPACGELFEADEGSWIDDTLYCPDCVRSCDICDRVVRADDVGEYFQAEYYCQDCAGEQLSCCEHCDQVFRFEDGYRTAAGEDYCAACAAPCAECGEACLKTELHVAADGPICPECLARQATDLMNDDAAGHHDAPATAHYAS